MNDTNHTDNSGVEPPEEHWLFDAPASELLGNPPRSPRKRRPPSSRGGLESNNDEPAQRRMILAADASSAALLEGVEVNGGFGIIFDTEADTLSRTLGQKWAGHEDLLRKFHAEEEASVQRVQGGYRVVERPYVASSLAVPPAPSSASCPRPRAVSSPGFASWATSPTTPRSGATCAPARTSPT